jgi:maltose O-acetyltransferase
MKLDFLGRLMRQAIGYYIFGCRVHVLGSFSVDNPGGVRLGKDCTINQGVVIVARNGILIGSNVILSTRCMIIDAGFEVESYFQSDPPEYEYKATGITIEDNVWVGAGAIVLSGVTIGRNSIIAAGAVVTRDVPSFSVAKGNPAKITSAL